MVIVEEPRPHCVSSETRFLRLDRDRDRDRRVSMAGDIHHARHRALGVLVVRI
jgi:hypothetical protein